MDQTENPGRERILGRIQNALLQTASKHASAATGPIFAAVPDARERFQRECAANNTECVVTPDLSASAAAVVTILAGLPAGRTFLQDAPALRRMASAFPDGRSVRWSSEGAPEEASQATITMAEALVASTGSVFVSASCGGRGASVVAPVHIVVASLDQLVPDLDAALARLRERGTAMQNSFICLITGSSRTADIEKILVLGAHGPRRLVVVLALRGE